MSRVRARFMRYVTLLSAWGLATSCNIGTEPPDVSAVDPAKKTTTQTVPENQVSNPVTGPYSS